MTHIHVYSKSPCVKCDGILRPINRAVKDGELDPRQVTVHMIDGSEPRAGKVHDSIEVVRVEDPVEQKKLLAYFEQHPAIGMAAPVVITKDDAGAEIDVFNDYLPDRIKAVIRAAADAPALATASA